MDKSLLKRAIEDTPDPTPGYMFRDISNWTYIDNNTQQKLITTLLTKLTPKASVHIIAKILRIIKVLCEIGHVDFQKEIQGNSDKIKEFANYRGKMDPKYEDKYNEKVRITAREAIEAAYSARSESKIVIQAGHGCENNNNNNNNWEFNEEAGVLPPIEIKTTLEKPMTPFEKEILKISSAKHTPQRIDLIQFLANIKNIHDNNNNNNTAMGSLSVPPPLHNDGGITALCVAVANGQLHIVTA
eukprot:Tbor_TRINITY_DN5231_c2_g2::TRINITY_DN5231_c2_g2_i2::g.16517::m.16517